MEWNPDFFEDFWLWFVGSEYVWEYRLDIIAACLVGIGLVVVSFMIYFYWLNKDDLSTLKRQREYRQSKQFEDGLRDKSANSLYRILKNCDHPIASNKTYANFNIRTVWCLPGMSPKELSRTTLEILSDYYLSLPKIGDIVDLKHNANGVRRVKICDVKFNTDILLEDEFCVEDVDTGQKLTVCFSELNIQSSAKSVQNKENNLGVGKEINVNKNASQKMKMPKPVLISAAIFLIMHVLLTSLAIAHLKERLVGTWGDHEWRNGQEGVYVITFTADNWCICVFDNGEYVEEVSTCRYFVVAYNKVNIDGEIYKVNGDNYPDGSIARLLIYSDENASRLDDDPYAIWGRKSD